MKKGYADPAVAAVAGAVQGVTSSVFSFLGIRQTRLAQEAQLQAQIEAGKTQLALSQEELWKQTAAQNAQFGQQLIELEAQKQSFWNTPVGISLMFVVPILGILIVLLLIKK